MPLDLDALTALRDLTAPRPEQRRPLPGLAALSDLVAVDLPRRRVVLLVVLAAAAGLLCGLLAPGGSALAATVDATLGAPVRPACITP